MLGTGLKYNSIDRTLKHVGKQGIGKISDKGKFHHVAAVEQASKITASRQLEK